MSASQLARQKSLSSSSRHIQHSQQKGKGPIVTPPFEPCAATASLFLYAQGSSILCLHHDTLALERRFEKHVDNIQLICVDNVSERGAGRLVVSYDVGQTAIVWDLFSGQEIARFASFEHITVAAWMRNGNVAFGNSKGEVILFEPSTSEHISARTIYDPITALAPSADCKAYAIGYNNGSILLATLQPTFTILHTLTTQRVPSPIAALAWHASSSKQKSDMLATQTSDGDLRVWSVSKPPTGDAPRVIRTLSKSENFSPGRNWISWSKNGRIVQYSERQTWSWDVRTKHVTYEIIPTVDDIRALSAYGPTATLFTLGPNHTIQQYDLDRPQMVANVQHLPMAVPPTPPEEYNRQLGLSASESEEDVGSPIVRANRQVTALEAARIERAQTGSPRSTRSRTESRSSQASSTQERHEKSAALGRTDNNSTIFSLGTQSQIARDSPPTSSSMTYPSSMQSPASVRSARKGSRLKQEVLPSPEERPIKELFPYTRSRLSDIPYKPPRAFDELSLTPDDLRRQMLSTVFGWEEDIEDLIRDELSRHPLGSQSAVLLSKWLDEDPDHMASMMGAGGATSNLDWMMLALSGLGNQAQSKKIGEAFVEKMLAKGDIHAAATILLSLGDYNDAIEVYVTRSHYMEAILLACLLMPQNWQRQSYLVREWGKHVVENSEQHLAIRCFSCTAVEPSEPWTSPTAQMAAKFTEHAYTTSQYSEPGQASGVRRDFLNAPTPVAMGPPQAPVQSSLPGRLTAKTQALKLITSFGPQSQGHYKFPGLKSDDRTPTNAPGITPIAESAIGESAMTPGGLGSYRLNNVRSINSALSARTATPGGFSRQRLPSIGETPIDIHPPTFPVSTAPKSLPTPVDSGSDKEKESALPQNEVQPGSKPATDLPLLLTSARYEPKHQTPSKETPLTAVGPTTAIELQPFHGPPSPSQGIFDSLKKESRNRNGSRDRKPDGLSIQWPPVEATMNEVETDQLATLAAEVPRSDTAGTYIDTHSDMTSPPITGDSFRTLKSPSVSGRSIDQYISSLEEAQYYTKHHQSYRTGSRDRSHGQAGERKRSKHRLRAPSEEDRGRGRIIPPAKRSPSSPVSMSPDELNLYNASVESFDSVLQSRSEAGSVKPERNRAKSSHGKLRSGSKTGDRHRHRSASRHKEGHKSRHSSRAVSRRHSPDSAHENRGRTRSKSERDQAGLGSPTSPLPMSPSGSDRPKHYEAEQVLRFVASDRQRLHAQHRSTSRSLSRRPDRGSSARRDASPDRRKASRTRSSSRQTPEREPGMTRKGSLSHRNEAGIQSPHRDPSADRRHHETVPVAPMLLGRSAQLSELNLEANSNPQLAADRRRKELAAAELEARRLSLARRPSAPPIPFPGQNMSPNHSKSRSMGGVPPLMRSQTDNSATVQLHNLAGRVHGKHSPNDPFSADAHSPPSKSSLNPRVGLPATPRAMRHPALSPSSGEDTIPNMARNPTVLSNDAYHPEMHQDFPRSMSAPIPDFGSPPLPSDLPSHPAFDRRLPTSRSSSKNRENAFSPPGGRQPDSAKERLRVSPREAPSNGRTITTNVDVPPTLPELQHLATPPPPPPPPAMAHHSPISHNGDVVTVGWPDPSSLVEVPGPKTAPSVPTIYAENPQVGHRRGRSVNENFAGKIRSITTRLRSTSRGRNTKSPPAEAQTPSPYESLPMHVDFSMA